MKPTNRSMVTLGNVKKRYLINIISCTIILLVIYLVNTSFGKVSFERNIMILICFNIILAVSLNLSSGCLGEMVLGHAAFMAVGAYATALLLKHGNFAIFNSSFDSSVNFIITIILAFICASIVGLLVGIPALRLKGDYLAIITLGFGLIIQSLLNILSFTGGPSGISNIPKNTTLILSVLVVIAVVTFLFTFMRSRHGRAILAIREDDIAAEATGIPVTKYKVSTFALSAGLAGIAGAIYAQFSRNISPEYFDLNLSIEFLVIVVLGGLGSFTGSIFATIILVLLPEVLRDFKEYRMIVYSIALIIIMLTKPSGLLGRYEFSMTRFIEKCKPKNIRQAWKKFIANVKSLGQVKKHDEK